MAEEQGEQTGHREGEERGDQVEAVHRRQQHQQPVSQQSTLHIYHWHFFLPVECLMTFLS